MENISELCIFKMKTKYGIDHYREFISASNNFASSTLQIRNDGYDLIAQLSVPLENFTLNNSTIDQYTNILFNTKTCPQYTGLLLHSSQMNDISVAENRIRDQLPNLKEIKKKFINENRQFLLEKYEKIQKSSTRTTTTTTKIIFYPKKQQNLKTKVGNSLKLINVLTKQTMKQQ